MAKEKKLTNIKQVALLNSAAFVIWTALTVFGFTNHTSSKYIDMAAAILFGILSIIWCVRWWKAKAEK